MKLTMTQLTEFHQLRYKVMFA